MRWRVESWDPGYGVSTEDSAEFGSSSALVDLDVEVPADRWAPVPAGRPGSGWDSVLFVDGVRRIDAMGWVLDEGADTDGDGGGAAMALLASYAAGVVCCRAGGARLLSAQVRRGLFTSAEQAVDVSTSAGLYRAVHARAGGDGQQLSLAVQHALLELELQTALSARAALSADAAERTAGRAGERDLLVVDGPLRGRQHLPRALGYVKTHRSEYLPTRLHRMVGTLAEGERTPVFGLGTSWQRYSWYLKLPGGSGAPWAGVVRLESSVELPVGGTVALADDSQALLCGYASTEYKDARAPQNLYPIAGLERQLRRRLGDQGLLYRAIRRSAGTQS